MIHRTYTVRRGDQREFVAYETDEVPNQSHSVLICSCECSLHQLTQLIGVVPLH